MTSDGEKLLKLDDFDRRILDCLQTAPQMSMIEIAERVGLSHTPCWRRVRRMEEAGLILGKRTLLDPRALGYPVCVLASVRIRNHDEAVLEAFETEVCSHPEIVECFAMSGESDYVIRVLARSIDDYEQFLRRVLLHLPGVDAINSNFALKHVKLTTNIPL